MKAVKSKKRSCSKGKEDNGEREAVAAKGEEERLGKECRLSESEGE